METSILSLRAAALILLLTFGCSDSDSSSGSPAPSDALPALSAVPGADEVGRIVDPNGREVLLRGVNVNAHVDYWQYDPELFTAYPFTEEDADAIAAMGWNMVRLLLSWSRVEPEPGVYDEAYLDQIADSVARLRERGVYTLIDLHQDAWGPSLVAPTDEQCTGDARPAGGWDGAPEWATFDDGEPRCDAGQRELVPAVQAAWKAFMDDVEGPGGIGIRTRYAQMFGHVVARFANDDAVAGYDVMNEPNVFAPGQEEQLTDFYEDCLDAMRAAEDEVRAPRRLFFFEPSIAWNGIGLPAPPPFDHDDQVVYAPHIYQGGIDPGTLEEGFARAAQDAVMLYEGAPVVTGEWGSSPTRAADPGDDYFERHLAEQDRYRFGATMWTWREACGDPHKYNDVLDGRVPYVWGFFELDCETNTIEGPRTALGEVVRKTTIRFAPGALSELDWSLDDSALVASGDEAAAGNRLEVWVPTDDPTSVQIETSGLDPIESVPWFDGTLFYANASGGSWSIQIGTPTDDEPIAYPLLGCDPIVPEFCGYPFPSNVYTVEDDTTVTGRRVALTEELLIGNDPSPWDDSDGFSAGTPILTYLPGVVGDELPGPDEIARSLTDESPTIVLNVETGERVPHFAEIDVRSPTPDQRSIIVRTVVRLRDDARYIVAIRHLRNEAGALIEPSADFAALREGTQSEDPSIETRRALYANIFEHLANAGWKREEIQIAWDFNTASDANNTRWLLHMRDRAFELVGEDGPEYTLGPCEDEWESDYIAWRVCGTYRVPLFMSSPEPGGYLVFGENGLPEVNEDTPWADIPFELNIPMSASAGNPAPTVQYGHGLFGGRTQIHGGGSQHNPSFMNEYNYAFVATELQGMSTYDFETVSILLALGDFSGLKTMFDRLHQGFVNYLLLTRMMKTSFAADPTYGQYIKGDESYYYGNSQGGIMGTVFLALSPDVERGALGVMGQPYSLLLFRSVDFNTFLEAIKLYYKDFRQQQLLIALAQMLWDRVEPTGYTHHIRKDNLPNSNPKEVLARAAIGDHQVPTLGAHVMARTLEAPLLDQGIREVWGLTTVASTEQGSFYAEYDFGLPGEPACDVPMSLCGDPHTDVSPRTSAREQLDEFFRLGTGTNHCRLNDGDAHPASADGVCSYPSIAGCEMGETEEDTRALCMP